MALVMKLDFGGLVAEEDNGGATTVLVVVGLTTEAVTSVVGLEEVDTGAAELIPLVDWRHWLYQGFCT